MLALSPGYHDLQHTPSSGAWDYIRSPLFRVRLGCLFVMMPDAVTRLLMQIFEALQRVAAWRSCQGKRRHRGDSGSGKRMSARLGRAVHVRQRHAQHPSEPAIQRARSGGTRTGSGRTAYAGRTAEWFLDRLHQQVHFAVETDRRPGHYAVAGVTPTSACNTPSRKRSGLSVNNASTSSSVR